MSRIGKKPVTMPSGVKAEVKGRRISVTGPKGTLSFEHPKTVSVAVDGSALKVTRASDLAQDKAFHGMTRALLNNMVIGVTQGYTKRLEIYGTGFSCALSGKTFEMNVGYSHPIKIPVPPGIEVKVEVAAAKGDETPAKFTVSGIDKHAVGQFARQAKDARQPEPYKGKGVRFEGEQIRRKAGKAFAGAGT